MKIFYLLTLVFGFLHSIIATHESSYKLRVFPWDGVEINTENDQLIIQLSGNQNVGKRYMLNIQKTNDASFDTQSTTTVLERVYQGVS